MIVGSEIRFPEKLEDSRDVEFEGEAYFDIAKSSKPFTIKMKNAEVKVLGTAFNLKSSPEDVKVLVDHGLVSLSSGEKEVKVGKGQMGVFETSTGDIAMKNSPPANIMSWRNGKFRFKDTPLQEATAELSTYYNVEFELSETVKNCRITINFDNDSLNGLIRKLEGILDISVTKEKSIVRIAGNGCQK